MLKFLSGLLAGVIAATASICVAAFTYFSKDRELDIEMVRISLSILAGEHKEESKPGRRFALRALSKYSDIEIPEPDFTSWVESGTLPGTFGRPICDALATQYAETVRREPHQISNIQIMSLLEKLGCLAETDSMVSLSGE